MSQQEEQKNPLLLHLAKTDYYLRLLMKRRWFLILPFCLAMYIGIFLAFTLPEFYQADNLIIVEPKSVPDQYVPTTGESSMRHRVETIKDQMLSRSNLTSIIKRLDLFSEKEYRHMLLEDKIAEMRRNTRVDVSKGGRVANSFKIFYTGRNPKMVQMVVNTLAETFITESVKVLREEVLQLNKFLESEVIDFRKRLAGIETIMSSYRKEHQGELPEEMVGNLGMLQRLQQGIGQKQESLRDARNRLVALNIRISAEKKILAELAETGQPAGPGELDRMRQQLAAMCTRYTERHPDIIRLRAAIAAKKQADPKEEALQQAGSVPAADKPSSQLTSKLLNELLAEQAGVDLEIHTAQADLLEMENQIRRYQKRIENTPKRELYLMDLQRNYENIERTYKNYLEKKLESDIAVNLQKKQKGEKFLVVDKAQLPRRPISPNLKSLFFACIAVGLGTGLAVIVLLEVTDNHIRFPEKIKTQTGVSVLATIPYINKPRGFFYRGNQILTVVFLILSMTLFAAFGLLTMKGASNTVGLIERIETRLSSYF